MAGAEAISKHSFRELSPAVLSAGRSLLGAVFALLRIPGARSCAEPGGEGLPRGWPGWVMLHALDAPVPPGSARHGPGHLSQLTEPGVAAGASRGKGGRGKGGQGKGTSRFCREHGRARRGSPSCCEQQSPHLCAGGLFTKGCGQTVEKFIIKNCSCSQRGFPSKDRPEYVTGVTCSPQTTRNCLDDKFRW